MFENLTPRWGIFLMGCIAIVLAPIPFIAYFKGPWIRARSPYSKILMAEEKKRLEAEQLGGQPGDVETQLERMEGEELMADEMEGDASRVPIEKEKSDAGRSRIEASGQGMDQR
ncbi:hypothetical protein IAU60_003732 [Kwoniella sp. DSM 27419]